MPLVFLDTPQIDLLERTRRTDPARYRSFLGTWKRLQCMLVLTLAQEGELRRYSDASRREGRYQLLADLAPIRRDTPTEFRSGDPHSLMDREIVRQVVERALSTASGPSIDRLLEWADVLPGRLDHKEAGRVRLMEHQDISDLINAEYNAARFSASAAKHEAQTKKSGRVRNIATAPPTREQVLALRGEIEKVFLRLREQTHLGELPDVSPHTMDQASRLAIEFLTRSSEIGPQATLLECLPVTRLTKDQQLKLTADELVGHWLFESRVRYVARELLRASESEQEFLVRTLDFADCPGSWLQRRLDVQVRQGSREPRPNHHFDSQRLGYLPYVDLLLADREMVELVAQIRNDKSTPRRVRQARPPLSIATCMDALEEVIHSLKVSMGEGATGSS